MEEWSAKRARIDAETIPESEILRLVALRESARQARRFSESDAIRDELRAVGIELYDKDKEWKAKDGRKGKLFTAGPTECVLSDMEIQDRINEREEARKNKDWAQADALRDELRIMGVELEDRTSTWRTSGGRDGKYSMAPDSRPLDGSVVKKIIAERERLRSAKEFEAADELRRQLASFGVEVFDDERVWKSADGQQGVIISGGHEVDCFLSESEIAARVVQREEARTAKNWAQADAIRDQLRKQGVELLDNQRQWCTTDGRHGMYASAAAKMATAGGGSSMSRSAATLTSSWLQPQQSAPPLLQVISQPQEPTTLSDASIIALITGREKARERHDWAGADAIRSDLRSRGVEVWDKEKVWRASDGRSGTITR